MRTGPRPSSRIFFLRVVHHLPLPRPLAVGRLLVPHEGRGRAVGAGGLHQGVLQPATGRRVGAVDALGVHGLRVEGRTHAGEHATLLEKYHRLLDQISDLDNRQAAYHHYREELDKLDIDHIEFTPYLWHTLVDHAEIGTDGTITFTFRDGRAQEISLDVDRVKSLDLLADGFLVVRLREAPLPSLNIAHPNYRRCGPSFSMASCFPDGRCTKISTVQEE